MSAATKKKDTGAMATVAAVSALTLLIAAAGVMLGMTLAMAPSQKHEEPPAAAAPEADHGAKPDPHRTSAAAPPKPGKRAIRELAPIVTNLSGSPASWIRLQVAVVFDPDAMQHQDIVLNEVASDIVAYLRGLSLRSIEGTEGLGRLNQELSERASVRSEGAIQELIIQSLVVQ